MLITPFTLHPTHTAYRSMNIKAQVAYPEPPSQPHAMSSASLVLTVVAAILVGTIAQDDAVWQANKKDFQIISANPLYGDQNFWVLIARRIPDANREARKIVADYERRTNAELPLINRRVNRLVFETEAKINRQYNDAERQLDETVRRAAARKPASDSDAVTELQYDTIPAAENEVNRAVFDAQQAINRIVRQTEVAVKRIVLQAEKDVNEAIPKSGAVVTDEVRSIIGRAEQRVDELLKQSGRKINARIAEGNRVVDANIAKVEAAANDLLPAKVGKKVTADIKEASEEIDDTIASGKKAVVTEVKTSTDKLKKIVPAIEKRLKAARK